jgi:uncharacterized protein
MKKFILLILCTILMPTIISTAELENLYKNCSGDHTKFRECLKKHILHHHENDVAEILKIEPGLVYSLSNYKLMEDAISSTRYGCRDGQRFVISDGSDVIKLLLKYKADVSVCDKCQETPLMLAARYGKSRIVELLCEAGANVHKKDKYGRTALFMALGYFGNLDVIKQLIAYKANINELDNDEQTPLMKAVNANIRDKDKIIDFLLEKGADRTLRDKKGRTAADIARQNENESLALLIENFDIL